MDGFMRALRGFFVGATDTCRAIVTFVKELFGGK